MSDRCPRCDRPLVTLGTEPIDGFCWGICSTPGPCAAPAIDWRARALAAEGVARHALAREDSSRAWARRWKALAKGLSVQLRVTTAGAHALLTTEREKVTTLRAVAEAAEAHLAEPQWRRHTNALRSALDAWRKR